MGARSARLLLVAALAAGGCGADEPDRVAEVRFTKVDLPAGVAPVVLSTAGDALLIGVRRDGQPVVPGLVRRGPDGALTEIAVNAVDRYARLATWRSIAADGERIVAVGGERGGAHGHVRWSVWTGSADAGVVARPQGFSTFGGYEAGDLVDAVLTPSGPAVVGGWASARVGFDVAVWTAQGEAWTRQPSAGTALESGADAMGFPMAATPLQPGILVAGWQLALDAGGRQLPAVWRSESGTTGWTRSVLPDSGQAGAALAARCWTTACAVAGRVDGKLAVWRLTAGTWVRLAGEPPVAVGDRDRLAAPVQLGEQVAQVLSDGGQVKIATHDGARWTVRPAAGPTGTVTAATVIHNTLYLLAGPDERTQTLWRADPTTVS